MHAVSWLENLLFNYTHMSVWRSHVFIKIVKMEALYQYENNHFEDM